MGYYALFYEVVDDFIARRGAYRDEHLRLAREAHARGELLLAGALADPPDGALLIFQGESPAAAEVFARQDPYVKNGLVSKCKVRKLDGGGRQRAARPLYWKKGGGIRLT
jgi:uncharacterized protein YciI